MNINSKKNLYDCEKILKIFPKPLHIFRSKHFFPRTEYGLDLPDIWKYLRYKYKFKTKIEYGCEKLLKIIILPKTLHIF